MSLENFWKASDFDNARSLWLATRGFVDRRVILRKFAGYEKQGSPTNPDEQFRVAKYVARSDHIWLSQVKVFDTVKGGYFTTGDLDVYTTFRLRGFTPAYTLPNGTKIEEYAGDEIVWNGKLWVVSDQVEPIQFGFLAAQIWWRTVLRRTDRAGAGITVGA